MRKVFFFMSVIGWLISLIIHLVSYAGIDIEDRFSQIWLFSIFIFIVWFPAIIYSIKENKVKDKITFFSLDFLKVIFGRAPIWLTTLAVLCFFYGFLSFWLHQNAYIGVPDIIDGQYVLHNHGSIEKVLTENEYHSYNAESLRSFSSFWLIFYGIAAAILYPFKKGKGSDEANFNNDNISELVD